MTPPTPAPPSPASWPRQEGVIERNPAANVRRPRVNYGSRTLGLDRNELGAFLVHRTSRCPSAITEARVAEDEIPKTRGRSVIAGTPWTSTERRSSLLVQ